jgi:phospholipase C
MTIHGHAVSKALTIRGDKNFGGKKDMFRLLRLRCNGKEWRNKRLSIGKGRMRKTFFSFFIFSVITFFIVSVPNAQIKHVVIQINENKNFADTFNMTNAPYMTGLIQKYGAIATNFYANTHPSIGNYFELLTGQILTNDDLKTPSDFPIDVDNLIRQVNSAGYTWKAHCENIPSVGYTGGNAGEYAVRHCAIPYLTDVQNNAAQRQNLFDFPQFTKDLQNNQLPTFSFVIPNLIHDVHDSDIPTGDNWIKHNMAQLFKSPTFYQDTVYIFTWDESADGKTHGGGKIETAFLGAAVKQGYSQQSSTVYQHASTGRTILWLLGINPPADMHDIATAPVMSEFFDSGTIPPSSFKNP